ncbi:MAG: biopolymer transporter ExbD, partial [Candidatus Omnitrophica bacterium]|nr:biopolymer transporter ExbD [Candidatus Omnitrophota bacterium]
MKFKRHTKLEHGLKQIDIAPLIDLMFLLLIFFMLTSSFTLQSGINVKLP